MVFMAAFQCSIGRWSNISLMMRADFVFPPNAAIATGVRPTLSVAKGFAPAYITKGEKNSRRFDDFFCTDGKRKTL